MERAKKIYARIEKKPTSQWNDQLAPFDDFLRSKGSKLNPGTTADLISGALFLALLLENVKFIY
jgi:triphosphoribosyl-dephospho-CoA synthetase